MSDIKSRISALIEAGEPGSVWVPADFAQFGNRDAIDKTLQRMALAGGAAPDRSRLVRQARAEPVDEAPHNPGLSCGGRRDCTSGTVTYAGRRHDGSK